MKRKRVMKKILYEILDWSKVLLTALVITFVVSRTLVANAQVPTGSMETTIMTGSRVLINRLSYVVGEPKRGDIIAFYFPDDKSEKYLKRIIGLPGDKVEGIDGGIYVTTYFWRKVISGRKSTRISALIMCRNCRTL